MEQQTIEQNKINRQIEAEKGDRLVCVSVSAHAYKETSGNKFNTFVHPALHQYPGLLTPKARQGTGRGTGVRGEKEE